MAGGERGEARAISQSATGSRFEQCGILSLNFSSPALAGFLKFSRGESKAVGATAPRWGRENFQQKITCDRCESEANFPVGSHTRKNYFPATLKFTYRFIK